MTPIDWGVLGAFLSTSILILLPWMLKVHARLAVALTRLENLESRLAAMAEKMDELVQAEHHRATSEALWETRLQTLETRFGESEL
ncbi:MAG: hypothetical protein WBH86_03375 [Thermogutta sp.]|nr:hypothetical protein [Thermogutta sp.]HPU05300.1 hypothetical protein [Thermogutta sp.]HQF12646.1 hypothetical protein [Thermogutta sp.]